MQHETYRYEFCPTVSFKDIEETLFLALSAAKGVHGEAKVRLEGDFRLCENHRLVAISASKPPGRDLARIFTQLLMEQFGEDAFTVSLASAGSGFPPETALPAGVSR